MLPSDLTWSKSIIGARFNALRSTNQRAYADYLEEYAAKLAQDECAAIFKPATSVRSPEDFMLGEILVDVKTRALDRKFSMPNLISVDRARKILKDPEKDVWYWFIDYSVHDDGTWIIDDSIIVPIWHLDWNALSIQNLGLGQIQISDWTCLIDSDPDRMLWYKTLVDKTREFYVNLQGKLIKRIATLDKETQ